MGISIEPLVWLPRRTALTFEMFIHVDTSGSQVCFVPSDAVDLSKSFSRRSALSTPFAQAR